VKTEQIEQFVSKTPEFVTEGSEPIDEAEVLRYLGYPIGRRPAANTERLVGQWIAEAGQRAAPGAAYVVLPVIEKSKNRLTVASESGETEFHGAIGRFLGVSRLIVAFIATAGPDVERLASQLMAEGDDLAAMIVNAVGAERAEAAGAVVIDRVREQIGSIGFTTTLPYSPGYCGMALTEQTQLFSLFGGATAGVSLTSSCLMQPIKSVSGLVGLAPQEEVTIEGSPCDRCELHSCNMRR